MLDKSEDGAETAESAILDSAATSSCCPTRSNLKKTGRKSDRIFQVPTGQVAEAGEEREWPHDSRAPANIVHEVTEMEQDPLMSMPKLVDAGYKPVITKDDVKIYNTADVEFTVKADAVLRGWREKETGLWRIPLEEGIDKDNVENPNTQTVLTQMTPTTILKEKNAADFMCNIYELRKQPEIV